MAKILELSSSLPTRSVASGETFLTEGDKDGEILILKSGTVEIQKSNKVVTAINTPGAIFGEVALLLDQGHTANAIALNDCEFYVMDDTDDLLNSHPELYREISKTLASRLKRVSEKVAELMDRVEFEKEFNDFELGLFWED